MESESDNNDDSPNEQKKQNTERQLTAAATEADGHSRSPPFPSASSFQALAKASVQQEAAALRLQRFAKAHCITGSSSSPTNTTTTTTRTMNVIPPKSIQKAERDAILQPYREARAIKVALLAAEAEAQEDREEEAIVARLMVLQQAAKLAAAAAAQPTAPLFAYDPKAVPAAKAIVQKNNSSRSKNETCDAADDQMKGGGGAAAAVVEGSSRRKVAVAAAGANGDEKKDDDDDDDETDLDGGGATSLGNSVTFANAAIIVELSGAGEDENHEEGEGSGGGGGFDAVETKSVTSQQSSSCANDYDDNLADSDSSASSSRLVRVGEGELVIVIEADKEGESCGETKKLKREGKEGGVQRVPSFDDKAKAFVHDEGSVLRGNSATGNAHHEYDPTAAPAPPALHRGSVTALGDRPASTAATVGRAKRSPSFRIDTDKEKGRSPTRSARATSPPSAPPTPTAFAAKAHATEVNEGAVLHVPPHDYDPTAAPAPPALHRGSVTALGDRPTSSGRKSPSFRVAAGKEKESPASFAFAAKAHATEVNEGAVLHTTELPPHDYDPTAAPAPPALHRGGSVTALGDRPASTAATVGRAKRSPSFRIDTDKEKGRSPTRSARATSPPPAPPTPTAFAAKAHATEVNEGAILHVPPHDYDPTAAPAPPALHRGSVTNNHHSRRASFAVEAVSSMPAAAAEENNITVVSAAALAANRSEHEEAFAEHAKAFRSQGVVLHQHQQYDDEEGAVGDDNGAVPPAAPTTSATAAGQFIPKPPSLERSAPPPIIPQRPHNTNNSHDCPSTTTEVSDSDTAAAANTIQRAYKVHASRKSAQTKRKQQEERWRQIHEREEKAARTIQDGMRVAKARRIKKDLQQDKWEERRARAAAEDAEFEREQAQLTAREEAYSAGGRATAAMTLPASAAAAGDADENTNNISRIINNTVSNLSNSNNSNQQRLQMGNEDTYEGGGHQVFLAPLEAPERVVSPATSTATANAASASPPPTTTTTQPKPPRAAPQQHLSSSPAGVASRSGGDGALCIPPPLDSSTATKAMSSVEKKTLLEGSWVAVPVAVAGGDGGEGEVDDSQTTAAPYSGRLTASQNEAELIAMGMMKGPSSSSRRASHSVSGGGTSSKKRREGEEADGSDHHRMHAHSGESESEATITMSPVSDDCSD